MSVIDPRETTTVRVQMMQKAHAEKMSKRVISLRSANK